jgi:CubicO group peptidase (beta-lactamase class C family)
MADGASRPPVRPVTVEDLLLHTSGLSHRTSDLYRRLQVRSRADTLPVFVKKITQAPLMEDPHTRFRYSEATTVLGRLVEVWSGQPFDSYLATRVLEPLGMRDTAFWVRPEDRARLATVYAPAPGGGLQPTEIEAVPVTERAALIEGAVGLVSTVPDFTRFAQMLLGGGELGGARLLRRDTVARITANGLPADVQQARGGSHGWGLANVNVLLADSSGPFPGKAGEYGWDGTAGTIFWVDPARDTVIVLMTQSAPANPGGLRQRFKQIVERAIRP